MKTFTDDIFNKLHILSPSGKEGKCGPANHGVCLSSLLLLQPSGLMHAVVCQLLGPRFYCLTETESETEVFHGAGLRAESAELSVWRRDDGVATPWLHRGPKQPC